MSKPRAFPDVVEWVCRRCGLTSFLGDALRTAILAMREVRSAVELQARLMGVLDGTTVNVVAPDAAPNVVIVLPSNGRESAPIIEGRALPAPEESADA